MCAGAGMITGRKTAAGERNAAKMKMKIGRMPHGPNNLITDVPGVRVGHCTVDEGNVHTGVTVVMPPCANPYTEKLTAAHWKRPLPSPTR